MADRRIRIAKDKVGLIKELSAQDSTKGFFRHMVDILTFAAALGFSRGRKKEIGEPAKSPDPIRQTVFQNYGYDTVINLLAVADPDSGDLHVLANNDEMEDRRAEIFEAYANGGLEVIASELKGAVEYLDSVLLLIANERSKEKESEVGGFDITRLMD